MRQTLWTPTYNRAKLLPRLYLSIKNQTFKDFVWLVIDDGSTDETKTVVQSFIDEGEVNIKYIYKENGGKHTAMKLAYEACATPYITAVDSDEELLPNAMQMIENQWIEIERGGVNNIARICLFCQSEGGDYIGHGTFSLRPETLYIDETWHEMVLRHGNNREMMGSLCLKKFFECFDFSKYTWHSDTNRWLGELILWSAVGRRYKTRLLNAFGSIYHEDAGGSLLRSKSDRNKLLNMMTNAFYFLDENMSYFWKNPRFFISYIGSYIILGKQTNTPFNELYGHIKHPSFKKVFLLAYIPFTIVHLLKLKKY